MAYDDWAIAGSLRYWVARKPQAPCITFEGTTWTWQDVFRRASQLGQALLSAGAQPQDRVAYLGKNRAEFFEILAGASMAGGVMGAVNWRLTPREILKVINHSGAKVLFVEPAFLGHVEQIQDQLTSVRTVVIVGDDVGLPGAVGYESWLGQQVAKDPEVPVAADDTALQIYTSGTTGLPKAAMFSNRATRAYLPMAELVHVNDDSVILVAMPVFHAAGASLGILSFIQGAHMIIAREAAPDELLPLISEHRVTMTTLVPAVLKMLVESPARSGSDLSSLETIAYAASPISPDLLRASLAAFSCRFLQIYGLTETNSATTLLPEDHLDPEHPDRMHSVGRPMSAVTLRIVDPVTGDEVAEGDFGEVWIKAPTNMSGYFDAPVETAATITPDGFIRTGDGGFVVDGYLYLKDRIKDMIVSGGENVYSVEVENVLIEDPRINDVAVIGVPSEKWGESVKAIVVREPGVASLTAGEVIAYAKANLAGYKCPTSVEFVDELPRNPSGKILKRVLRQQFAP
jgi:long-chain acyl-CoA synthetase